MDGFKYANGTVGVVYGIAGQPTPLVIESLFNGQLPQAKASVFLEFDYRSTRPFRVGVLATPVGGLTFRLWTFRSNQPGNGLKSYVNLTEELNITGLEKASFQMRWQVDRQGNPQEYFAIDNVRLIHF